MTVRKLIQPNSRSTSQSNAASSAGWSSIWIGYRAVIHYTTNEISTSKVEPEGESAVIFTVIWVIIILMLPFAVFVLKGAVFKFSDLNLNELGDYLAGVAAPIAFFWLVMGYRQQSKELGVNNRILELQQEELKNSVAAQQEQAKSLREQLNILIRDKYYPKFNLTTFEKYDDMIEIILHNSSNQVYGIETFVLSNDMMVNETVQIDDGNVRVVIQMIEDFDIGQSNFDIILNISFLLESVEKVSMCYKIEYHEYQLGPGNLPNLAVIRCEDEDEIIL